MSRTTDRRSRARGVEDGPDHERLYREFGPWLLVYARSMRPTQAEDLVQEAFTVLLKRSGSPPPVHNQRGYLVRTVQNLATKYPKQPASDSGEAGFYLDHYRDPDLAAAFEQMSPQQQTCVALRYGQDQTIPQIAELLELEPSTAKTHIHRALVQLKQQLGGTQ